MKHRQNGTVGQAPQLKAFHPTQPDGATTVLDLGSHNMRGNIDALLRHAFGIRLIDGRVVTMGVEVRAARLISIGRLTAPGFPEIAEEPERQQEISSGWHSGAGFVVAQNHHGGHPVPHVDQPDWSAHTVGGTIFLTSRRHAPDPIRFAQQLAAERATRVQLVLDPGTALAPHTPTFATSTRRVNRLM